MHLSNARILVAASVAAALAPAASAQTASALLRTGDALPGFGAHTVSVLNEPVVNGVGGYGIGINSFDGVTTVSRSWGNSINAPGGVLFSELTNVSGVDQISWEFNLGIDNLGRTGYGPVCAATGTTTPTVDCVWLDGTKIAHQGDPVLSLPGKVFRFNSAPKMIFNGTIYWQGGYEDVGGANDAEGLFLGPAQTPVIKTGDVAPAPIAGTIVNIDLNGRFSANGTHWIMNCDTSAATSADEWMLIDGAVATTAGGGVVGEAQLLPVAAGGLPAETWSASFGQVGITEAGDWCFFGDTNASTAVDVVLVHNGAVRWREGSLLDGMLLGGAENDLSMNEDGDIAHTWTVAGAETLFVNDEFILKEGDTVDWTGDGIADAGHVITDIEGLNASVALSARSGGAVYAYFVATVDLNGGGMVEGYFRVRVQVESGEPYCFGDGSGTACPCTPVPLVGDPDKGCPNGFNAGGGKLTASGTPSISADTLVMTCTTINNGGAVVFQGTNDNGGGLGTAFGDGLRCAAGAVRRMRSHAVTTNSHQYPDPMFGDNAISIRGAVLVPGDRWYQGWYRSGLAHCNPAENYNLTNGVKVSWGP